MIESQTKRTFPWKKWSLEGEHNNEKKKWVVLSSIGTSGATSVEAARLSAVMSVMVVMVKNGYRKLKILTQTGYPWRRAPSKCVCYSVMLPFPANHNLVPSWLKILYQWNSRPTDQISPRFRQVSLWKSPDRQFQIKCLRCTGIQSTTTSKLQKQTHSCGKDRSNCFNPHSLLLITNIQCHFPTKRLIICFPQVQNESASEDNLR